VTSAEQRSKARTLWLKAATSDEFVFLRACLHAPFEMAALLPSGKDLSREIAGLVDPNVDGSVVELGPGTGAITAALVARGIAPERLILIELNPAFCALLRTRYPSARIIGADAFTAPAIIKTLDVSPLAAAVSFLPLYGRTPASRQKLLLDLLLLGRPGAPFIQATYFPRSPIPIDRALIQASSSRRIWRNLVPAVVWTYRLASTN
jgi:phosphatidylethanolamine/phosphatidyl-N-methylethanolamine N-methyltransferase